MANIGVISYATGGALFLALTILLITSWRGRLQGGLLVVASLASTVWAFALAYGAAAGAVPFLAVFLPEIARDAAWIALLLGLLGVHQRRAPRSRAIAWVAHGLWIAALLHGVGTALRPGEAAFGTTGTILGLLVVALTGLVLVEQLYRNTQPEKRWAIKFLCLGIGGVFAYDLFLYSQGLLFRQLDASLWQARGAVNALVVPLIAISAARNPQWSLNVFVSRHVVFYTASLVGAGVYLLAMAAGGYYLRIYGGSWGAVAQVVLLSGAGLVLFVIMLSGEARARFKVFLAKHFYKNKYDYREEWLRLIRTLSAPAQDLPMRERVIKAVAQIVESGGGGLWTGQGDKHLRPVAQWNMEVPANAVEPADGAFTQYLAERQWVIDVNEYRADPERYGGMSLPAWLQSLARAWLVIPLMQEQQLLGFMVLSESPHPQRLTWEDTDLLKTVGCQVASYLAQHEAAQLLAEVKQFDAYNRLTAFIMHDLKNLIAQQSLVVKNATKHKNNPAFIEDAIATIENSVQRMTRLLEQLKRGDTGGSAKRIVLSDLLTELIARHGDQRPVPELHTGDEEVQVYAEPDRLGMALGHIIRNAQEATAEDGYVSIEIGRVGDTATVEIRDNGCGMDSDFMRERLFRPFDTTKGSKGMGIGAYQVREFMRAAGGEVEVTSKPGEGTTFRITLPATETTGVVRTYKQAGIGK